MKRIILPIAIIIATLTACVDNVYINGDLDGMWQLQKVENADTTIYPKNIYYSFQRNLSFLSQTHEVEHPTRYLGNLSYDNEKYLTIWGFRQAANEGYVATIKDLQHFVLFDTLTQFTIEKLDNKQLIMQNAGYRYSLKKW